MTILKLENVSKSFQSGPNRLQVLRHFDMEMQEAEMVAIVGRSGSGKTTLLNLIAGLDQVSSGTITLNERNLTALNQEDWNLVRQSEIGFVFQFNQLLPEFTALENVMLPGLLQSRDEKAVREKARQLLDKMDMGARTDHRPAQMSGGEQQRVAIARALINSPKLLLADEPTGSLDLESGQKVFNLLLALQEELKISCLVVTHNPALAQLCARIQRIDGNETGEHSTVSGS